MTQTRTNADAVNDHQELFDLTLEIGETAKKLEILQHQLTEKLCSMAERQGIEPDAMVFGASSPSSRFSERSGSCDLGR